MSVRASHKSNEDGGLQNAISSEERSPSFVEKVKDLSGTSCRKYAENTPDKQPAANIRNPPIYKLYTQAAVILSDTDRPSLQSILGSLQILLSLLDIKADVQDLQRLLFAIVGWLTMLYASNVSRNAQFLSIELTKNAKGEILASEKIDTTSLELRQASNRPIHQVLKHFGRLLPSPRTIPAHETKCSYTDLFSEQLVVSCLDLGALVNIAGIQVVFVRLSSGFSAE
ncbi:hypothetical protein BDZ45DRAFT_749551 [Acephala macrosclerotiorum]|nr:hypothetical protein BDZ45DRAFT_749551 [Acephala macrosclerotiorum]